MQLMYCFLLKASRFICSPGECGQRLIMAEVGTWYKCNETALKILTVVDQTRPDTKETTQNNSASVEAAGFSTSSNGLQCKVLSSTASNEELIQIHHFVALLFFECYHATATTNWQYTRRLHLDH